MTRRQRAPKGSDRDRADRRIVVDVLLARAQRGVLAPAEAALLATHVREEQRAADATRRALAGTTQTLERHRDAADAAIVEAEERAADAERRHVEAVAEQQQTASERDRLARDVAAMHDGINQTAREAFAQRRQHRQALAEQHARTEQALAALARVRQAQSLGDALAAVAEHNGLSPEAARTHGRILDQADTIEARLAEQQREHDIALAAARRQTVEVSQEARAQQRAARRYRTAWLAARRDRRADRAAMAAELPLVQAVERVRALAIRMRAGSPQGVAAIYADRIEQALDNEHQEQHV
ncbi:hypothetical protein ACWEV4_02500 [Streptomyces sp. NPDC003860]